MQLATAEQLIEAYKNGKFVILIDDEERENEGDIMIASENINAEAVNFMAKYGRGLICLTITEQKAQKLNLSLMPQKNINYKATNFTVSIEAKNGISTGISAADRAHTILTAIAKDAKENDITTPGHVFPIIARAGGILTRAGHTEAGCDLATMAGLEPSSVIVEVMNEDGTMARKQDLEIFATKHGILLGTIANLIEYRFRTEKGVELIYKGQLALQNSSYQVQIFRENSLQYHDLSSYVSTSNLQQSRVHSAIIFGNLKNMLNKSEAVNVRVHISNDFVDTLNITDSYSSLSLKKAFCYMAEKGGVLLILNNDSKSTAILKTLQYLQSTNRIQPEFIDKDYLTNSLSNSLRDDIQTFGIGAQILREIGLTKILVLGSQHNYKAIEGFGIEIVGYLNYPLQES